MADKIRLGLIGAGVTGTWSARPRLPAVQASSDFETGVDLHRMVDAIKQASDSRREATFEPDAIPRRTR